MSPSLGRFVTPDPIKSFLNPYSYVNNNPINMIDPLGLMGGPPPPVYDWHPETFDERSIASSPSILRLVAHFQNSCDRFTEQKEQIRLKKLMLDAAVEAEKMASTIGNDVAKRNLEAAAQKLRDCANNGKYAVLSSIPDAPDADAGVPGVSFDEKGNASSSGMIVVASKTMQQSDDVIIGTLIHEALHLAFIDKFPNAFSVFDQNMVETNNTEMLRTKGNAKGIWKARTEALSIYCEHSYLVGAGVYFNKQDDFIADPARFIDDHLSRYYEGMSNSRPCWEYWLFLGNK